MKFKNIVPFIIAIAIFIIASLTYFSPVLKGKKIQQSDITQFIGSSKEIVDFRDENKEEPYWTNATFGGMPSYAVSTHYPHNYVKKIDALIRFLPRPADYLFLYFVGFFTLLLVLKVDWKLAIIGALGFGFSTYLIIILGVGHNAKAHAIAYMPVVLAGMILVFQKRYFVGFVLTAIAMALELQANHIQMTYYLMFIVIILGIVQFIDAFKKKELSHFAKSIGVLLTAVILAIGVNATNLLATQEYAKQSIRSKSELTINPDGTPKEASTGLSKDYITEYSYGKLETFNLFIPRFMGGTSHEEVEESELEDFLKSSMRDGLGANDANYLFRISSMYWGSQPIVAAPAYIGAVFIFLFVLALFLVKGNIKKWLVSAVVFSILMSWGKNMSFLTDFFINYFPLYNKFRAVSSIQVIAELCIPLLGILGLKEFLSKEVPASEKLKALKWTSIIVGGLAIAFTLIGTSLFSFETPIDIQIDEQISGYAEAVSADRKSLFFGDSLRSLILVLTTAAFLWLYLKEKINKNIVFVLFALVVLFDLVKVDKRYVNDEAFMSARKVNKPFKATAIDKEILKDTGYYRVINLTLNPMNDGSTSYFHKSVGGYHAAKPRRYQELYDFQIAKGNPEVLNMLNTKYIIISDDSGKAALNKNDEANGNAWFVNTLNFVSSADEELISLDKLNTKNTAVVLDKYKSNLAGNYAVDSLATIKLTAYKANELTFESNTSEKQFAVFSDVYYESGWNAYIDGQSTEIYPVNYVLRAIEIPKGKHQIIFKFEPSVIKTGSIITVVSFVLLFVISAGWYISNKKKNK